MWQKSDVRYETVDFLWIWYAKHDYEIVSKHKNTDAETALNIRSLCARQTDTSYTQYITRNVNKIVLSCVLLYLGHYHFIHIR